MICLILQMTQTALTPKRHFDTGLGAPKASITFAPVTARPKPKLIALVPVFEVVISAVRLSLA